MFLIACAIPGVVGFVFIDRLLALSLWLGIPVVAYMVVIIAVGRRI
ncbi:hypothetical protein G8C93_06005 [Cellulosimicrobium cellulans]|nr:hypothetical protein [Cellulosimicrobium cellulans]MBE9925444.1 hypothetical protein [Cellulosimicrobium cellulans]